MLRRSAPFRCALLIIALALSSAAAAQDTPPRDSDPIIVIGDRDNDRQIADFVEVLAPAQLSGQLGRYHWAVCPVAVGMAPTQRVAVSDRIRAVARAADVRVAGADCTPNLLVIVTPDKAAFLALLARRHSYYFEGLARSERHSIMNSVASAVAWQIPGPPIDADGRELANDSGAGFYVNRTIQAGSRIGSTTHPQFAAAIVVIESAAIDGLKTTQLADYAAMSALTAADPARLEDSSVPTILTILDAPMGSAVPVTLTEWDLGLLRAFYAANPLLSTAAQRSDMRRDMAEDLQSPREGGN